MKRANGKVTEVQNIFMQMRQLSSGFIRVKTEEGERIDIDFPENPKLDYLLELIDEFPSTKKMVVFHEFIHTGGVISEALKKKKLKFDALEWNQPHHGVRMTSEGMTRDARHYTGPHRKKVAEDR